MFKIHALPLRFTHIPGTMHILTTPISYLLLQTLLLIACFISSPRYPKYLQKSKWKSSYTFSLTSTSDDSCTPYQENSITNPFPSHSGYKSQLVHDSILSLDQLILFTWIIKGPLKSILFSTPKFRPSPFCTLVITVHVTHVDNNR